MIQICDLLIHNLFFFSNFYLPNNNSNPITLILKLFAIKLVYKSLYITNIRAMKLKLSKLQNNNLKAKKPQAV